MRHGNDHVRSVRFHQALGGLPYPATKKEIAKYVQNRLADNGIYDRVRKGLADKTYRNETEVLTELGAFDPHKVSSRQVAREEIIIPRELRLRGRSLVIAAARQGARMYVIDDAIMLLVASLKMPNHRFSDAEGYFKTRMTGLSVRSGVAREYTWQDIERRFLQDFHQYLRRVNPENFAAVYVFVPSYVKNDLMDTFPANFKKKIRQAALRNYYHFPPLELVKKVRMYEEEHAEQRAQEPQLFKYR